MQVGSFSINATLGKLARAAALRRVPSARVGPSVGSGDSSTRGGVRRSLSAAASTSCIPALALSPRYARVAALQRWAAALLDVRMLQDVMPLGEVCAAQVQQYMLS